MPADREDRAISILTAGGAVLAVAVCCAGPALITGGVLGAVGGLLRNPLAITAGVLIVVSAIGYAVSVMRRRGTRPDDVCCPPGERHLDEG